MIRKTIASTFATLLTLAAFSAPVFAETPAEARLRQERIRTTLVAAFDEITAGDADRDLARERLERHLAAVVDLGPEAVEFLIPEIENPGDRYFLSTVFLGALGNRDAVPAPRTAIDAAA